MAEERTSDAPTPDVTDPAGTAEPAPADVDAALAALTPEEREVLAKVADIVRRIRFGTVVLVIQDGKVVQIEMAEKFRLR
ncbi:MAG TPA: YezD family protein [Actinomycetota bacterium]|jgi:hypothetical protein